ncbi:TatD family hydrolase [Acidocella sp. KAb 2-4]|uniref:TatD family hydrolase n=1 Tax=Acidocella sp. KAb 2-4 TaxID=2885158 RepID=UPI001D092E5E|nr:TatD family hydrolase [Acidocella sp. KAb 2-4]MCB5943244.1 TatD family hydrolase [Acidocella sp. KAb 2-4]
MLVDTHCHLDYFNKPGECAEVVARAVAAGVGEMVTIGVTFEQSKQAIDITEKFDNVWACVGVHPNHAADVLPVTTPEALAALAQHPKVIGIGESGLDYFYDKAPKDIQAENFRANIRAAQLTGLPLCIHARDADDDIALILKEEQARGGAFGFLLHCFSSTRALAEAALEMGGYISFSGILTFPKAPELREIARDVPPERLLVETDSPYLAPAPFRGKRNEPAYTVHTAAMLAEIKGLAPDALADLTTRNFKTLFRKAA